MKSCCFPRTVTEACWFSPVVTKLGLGCPCMYWPYARRCLAQAKAQGAYQSNFSLHARLLMRAVT